MSDLDKILALIDCDEVIELTQRLVRIPSISGEEGNEIRDFMTDYFNNLDIPVRHSEVKEGRTNFFCDLTGDEPGTKILFNGHNDTKWVEGMTVDPFAAEIRDGKMYGRGTCDMKAGLAAIFSAFKAVKKSGMPIADIQYLLALIASKICTPPFPEKEVSEKINSEPRFS